MQFHRNYRTIADGDNDMSITWTRERRKLSDLIPWERNPRYIKKDDAERLAESLDNFGQIHAIAIGPDNQILDGHQRQRVWAAVDKYGPDYQVDVRVASRTLTEQEHQKLAAMLHTGAVGSWDWDALASWEFEDLKDWGFDTSTLQEWNDNAANLNALLDANEDEPPEDVEPQIDRAEELREKWGVELGQLWQLGEHRLICGDCTDADVVDRLMGGEKAQMCFTSPPYNAGVSAKLRGNTSIDDNLYKNEYNDNKPQYEWFLLMRDFTNIGLGVSDYLFVNVQSLAGNKRALIQYWSEFVDFYADVAIWDKQHAAPAVARRVMDSRFEFVLVF